VIEADRRRRSRWQAAQYQGNECGGARVSHALGLTMPESFLLRADEVIE
jgi:hypothetical protein